MNRLVLSALSLCALAGVAQADIFTNPAPIAILDNGTANPYPSTITVPGTFSGPIASVTVVLSGLTHTFPDDIDVLLVGPTGQTLILMSDCGGSTGVTNLNNLTFADGNPLLPDGGPLVSGTFAPTNFGAGDTFAAPAPAVGANTTLAGFNGLSAVGVWSLYVVDDLGGDIGSFEGGWSIRITLVPTPGAAAMLGLGGLLVSRRRR